MADLKKGIIVDVSVEGDESKGIILEDEQDTIYFFNPLDVSNDLELSKEVEFIAIEEDGSFIAKNIKLLI